MKRKKPMLRTVPASEAKSNFGEVIKRVYEQAETQIIERAGIPVAAIVSMTDLERLYPDSVKDRPKLGTSVKQEKARRNLVALLNARPAIDASEDEVERAVLKAVNEVRYRKRKKK